MKTKSVPVAILARVSTAKQIDDRQVQELQEHAERSGWTVVKVIRNQVSGSSRSRPDVDEAVALAESGKIAKLLVHEVSRLGRRPALVHDVVERLHDAGASLYWHAQRIETLLPGGKRNPAAGIMLAVMAEMAQAERELLVERTRSGLEAAKRAGKTLGRPKGSTMTGEELLRRHPDVVRHLKAGQSVRNTAAITRKSPTTIQAVRKAYKAHFGR